MIKRHIRVAISSSLKDPVVGIVLAASRNKILAKIIGKGLSKKVTYLDLELPSDLNKLQDHPNCILVNLLIHCDY